MPTIPIEVIEAFVLMLARTTALFIVAPILGMGTQFSGYRVAIIFSVAFVLYIALGEPLPPDVDPGTFAAMMVRELLIGAFLGFSLDVVMLAVRVAGEMIGHEMGFMMSKQADPVTGIQSSLITNFYEGVFILAMLAMNGHHWLLRALDHSFEIAPVGRVELGAGMSTTFQAMFAEMFGAGVVFAAPVMIFLLMTSLMIGLLARAVPTLNVLEIGFSLRVCVSLGAMYLFAPLLEPSIQRLHELYLVWLERMLASTAV